MNFPGKPLSEFVERPTVNAHYFLDFGINVQVFDDTIWEARNKLFELINDSTQFGDRPEAVPEPEKSATAADKPVKTR